MVTCDANGRHPQDGLGQHAAIFLGKNAAGIQVLDQWNRQGQVLPRTICFSHAGIRSDNGDTFYVIE